ncbi:hypothetical protein [Rhodoferax sp.]|uniref:hypothetical protein n=1 Tax=Rhodoferax sp. TaxID=50421 RepID=UPI002623C56E|nr:hypothetical protein [Rhodoferax sp.]
MAMLPIHAVCTTCNTSFNQVPTRTSLGFQRLKCPECKKKVTYPLTNFYRAMYWVFFVLMMLLIVNAFSQGGFGVPGGIGLAIVYALFMDRRIRNRIANPTY